MSRICPALIAAVLGMLVAGGAAAESLEFRVAERIGGLSAAQRAWFAGHVGGVAKGCANADSLVAFVNSPWEAVPSPEALECLLAVADATDDFTREPRRPVAGGFEFDDSTGVNRLFSVPGAAGSVFLDGLATFLTNRAREEFSALYLEKVREEFAKSRPLCPVRKESGVNSESRDHFTLREVFPAVAAFLQDSELVLSTRFGPSLRAAYAEDLRHLVERIDRYVVRTDARTPGYRYALAAYFGTRDLLAGDPVPSVLAGVERDLMADPATGLGYAVSVTTDLAEACRAGSGARRTWLPPSRLAAFDQRQWSYFLRLLRERNPAAYDELGISVDDLKTDRVRIAAALHLVLESLTAWDELARATSGAATGAVAGSGSTGILGSGSATPTPTPTAPNAERKWSAYVRAFDRVLVASMALTEVASDAPGDDTRRLAAARSLTEIALLVGEERYDRVVPRVMLALDELQITGGGLDEALRYASFAADVAMAESSAQVAELFEQAALPLGSARQKGRYKGLYLNAYVGVGLGAEWVDGHGGTGLAYGAFAPVGLEYAVSGKKSWLFSVLDVGALVSYRVGEIDGGEVDSASNATLRQVFSPGIFYVCRPKENPLALCFGAQLAPELRKVTLDAEGAGDPVVEDEMAFRLTFAVTMDIPIFRF